MIVIGRLLNTFNVSTNVQKSLIYNPQSRIRLV